MSTIKNTSGDYTINLGPIDAGTGNGHGTLVVNGSLDVYGNITYVDQLDVNDPFITVAGNNVGQVSNMGLLGQTSANSWAGLKFNTNTNSWQISPSVDRNGVPITPYSNIASGNLSAGGSNTQVQFNQSGVFGGNVNLTYDYGNSVLTIQGIEVYGNIGNTPSYSGNGVAVYNNTIGQGGTGLYVKNSTVDQELVSKSQAIIFGIIF
jgi:hypothetical protein